jgi:SAM-dependent methyltransferase
MMASDCGGLRTIGERKMASHDVQSKSRDQSQTRPYREAAAHYLAGRPFYADRLIRRVAARVGLTHQHRVLDLGCGPGPLARAFAPLAGEVVAMDPEPAMLRAGQAAHAGIANIRFVAGGWQDLAPSLGRFRLVVMGRSFHWMDRPETLRRLDGMVEAGGAVVLFHARHAAVPANDWVERYSAVRHRYTDAEPVRHRSGMLRHEAFLLDSAFCCVESVSVFEQSVVDGRRLVDRALSMSSTAPDRLGERAEDLERDILTVVSDLAPDGRLTEVIESTALIGQRPQEGISP